MNFQEMLKQYDEQSKAFWAKTRYVIHGMATSEKFKDMAWGFGIVPETSDRVYIYDDRAHAAQIFRENAVNSPDKSVPLEFEIREVHEQDLRTTYLKARLIGG